MSHHSFDQVKLRSAIKLVLAAASEAFPGVHVSRLRFGVNDKGTELEVQGPGLSWISIPITEEK